MQEPITSLHERSDGRSVCVTILARGGADARTVVLCHPAPGAGDFDPDPGVTAERDVTLIGVDRPGYGRSDPVGPGAWSSVDLAADDLAAVLDAGGAGPVGVVGWSAGGRVALALAARRPDLVDRVVVVATPAPHEAVPWIPAEQAQGLDHLRELPAEAVHAALAAQFSALVPEDPAGEEALALLGATAADRAALRRPGARARLGAMVGSAFARGPVGLALDIAGFSLRPWSFEPRTVKAPVLLLYGAADPVVGHRHARWWQGALPKARIEMVPGAGHLLILTAWRRALEHAAPHTLLKEVAIA